MVFSAPRSEGELMLHVPASNRPGVFPRDLLGPLERVTYETRPSFARLYWGRTILAVFLVGLFLLPLGQPGYATNPALYLFLAIFLTPVLSAYRRWSQTAYALTNVRILVARGRRRFQDMVMDQVGQLSVTPGYSGGIRFDATRGIGPSGIPPGRSAHTLLWYGLYDAPQVYAFVQQAFAVHHLSVGPVPATIAPPAPPGQAPAAPPAAWTHSPRPLPSVPLAPSPAPVHVGGLVACPRCGTVVDSNRLVPYAPTCPNCGAPIPLAGGR